MLLTSEINRFREAARHLWNSYLGRDADWDSVEAFQEICLALFEQQVLRRQGLKASPIPVDDCRKPLEEYRLFAPHSGRLPLRVNRDVPASGYWDFPVEWIPPEERPEIKPMGFFDFDSIGMRNLEFYRVRILDCPSHPEINGRDALVRCETVELELLENERTN
jgi:hypothetical protein